MKHFIFSLLLVVGMLFALPAMNVEGIDSVVKAETRVKITGKGVRLRYGPGLGYAIYCQLNKGATCAYYGTYGDWYKVGYNGGVYYVSRDFSSLYNTSSGYSSGGGSYSYITVHAKNLLVRTGPGTNYPYLVWNRTNKPVLLNHGDRLVYLGQSYNGFYKVKFDGKVCWVSCQYAY